MSQKKRITEFAVNMHCTHLMLLQQEDLTSVNEYNYFSSEYPCHIYFICRRPRLLIDPTKFKVTNEVITFPFKSQKEENFDEFEINYPNKFNTTDFILTSDYPYNSFEQRRDGIVAIKGKSAVLLQYFGSQYSEYSEYSEYLDLEVLYIGQSYGVDGARTAPDRLQSHSTLQGIYNEAIRRNPDCEIWLLLTSFEKFLITSMDGRVKLNEEELVKDSEHLKKVTSIFSNNDLDEQLVINFTEAAFIRYFQPSYNKEYKNTFPNPAHSTYSQCYDLDINAICIELETDSLFCRLYSKDIEKKWQHIKEFPLHNKEERKSMFEI